PDLLPPAPPQERDRISSSTSEPSRRTTPVQHRRQRSAHHLDAIQPADQAKRRNQTNRSSAWPAPGPSHPQPVIALTHPHRALIARPKHHRPLTNHTIGAGHHNAPAGPPRTPRQGSDKPIRWPRWHH